MAKATVVKVFVGSVIAVIAGLVLAFAAVWVAYANGVFVMQGPDVVGVETTPFAWTMVGLALLALLAMIGGFIGGLVSWIGALLNTAQVEDKTWFILLLVLGLLSFGVVAMIAYVIAGPDGTQRPIGRVAQAPV
jgi:H+/Cl- antiporter ClcA